MNAPVTKPAFAHLHEGRCSMNHWLRKLWCEWTHGGGKIDRDSLGRINWRCAKCGRWSDNPVPLAEERHAIEKAARP